MRVFRRTSPTLLNLWPLSQNDGVAADGGAGGK